MAQGYFKTTLSEANIAAANAEKDMTLLKKRLRKRKMGYRLFILTFGWWVLRYFWAQCMGLFGLRTQRESYTRLVHSHFKTFFRFRGVAPLKGVTTLPAQGERGKLILVPRNNAFTSLFAYQLFDYPVVIPLAPAFDTYRAAQNINWPFMGEALQCVRYPDGSLNANLHNVKALVEAGYTVVVYINDAYINPRYDAVIPFYTALETILSWDVDTYALRLLGFESYPLSTLFTPLPVTVDCADVYTLIGKTQKPIFQMQNLAKFWGFRSYRLT